MNRNALQGAIMLHNKTAKAFAKASNSQKIQMAGEMVRLNSKLLTVITEVLSLMQTLRVTDLVTLQMLCIHSAAAFGFARKVEAGIRLGHLQPSFESITPPEWEQFQKECSTILETLTKLKQHVDEPLVAWLEEQMASAKEDLVEDKSAPNSYGAGYDRGNYDAIAKVLKFIRGEADE